VMIEPPPISPPPVRRADKQWSEDTKLYWLVASAVVLGLLLAIIVLPWVRMPLGFGEDGDHAPSGESKNVPASLDADQASASVPKDPSGASSESVSRSSEQSVQPRKESDFESVKTGNSSNESNEAADSQGDGNDKETQILIVEQKPTVDKNTQAGSSSKSLEESIGANPFVGSGPPAKSTAYVIDVSGSMQSPDRFPRVIASMKRALELLKPNQTFQVVLFDDNFHLHPIGGGLIPANEKNKITICEWLDQESVGGGGTNPLTAMMLAIQERPERIVLLSDGEFDPSSASVITQLNQSHSKPAIIDCVGLMEHVETLKSIARLNKGVYYQAY
jgi:hypothetical protein